jgi:putative FmdB family regulatory protein
MPTYDYKCSQCEHIFDKILKIADRDLPTLDKCPNCNCERCVELEIMASSLVSPFRIEGLKKPHPQFRERMQQIKGGLRHKGKHIKDY